MDDSIEQMNQLRVEYLGAPFDRSHLTAEPIALLEQWLQSAISEGLQLANAMTLATCSGDGQPSARVVLLKRLDQRGLTFFTNYESDKGRQLAANPRAAATFWWEPLSRQVRVEGHVEKVSAAESDAYFATRPRQSNLSGMASRQSGPIPDRATLEARVAELTRQLRDRELERPAHWGGYLLTPHRVEFWQGRADRLHDRFRYTRVPGDWQIDRLCP